MGNEEDGQQSNVDEALETEAREMHWVPKEEYRGNPDDWLPAKEFVERGRQIMPILRENNKRLMGEQRAMQEKVRQMAAELEAAREDFSTLEEFHNEEVTRRVKETRDELLSQIKAAKREGDIDAEVDLQDQLSRLNSANAQTEDEIARDEGKKSSKKGAAGEQQVEYTPAYLAWKEENDWFEVDAEKTYLAMAHAARIVKEKPDLKHEAFFTELDARLNGKQQRPGRGKVEESRGGSSNRNDGGRTYADLPADARAQCDKYAAKFVKKDGRFKTVADYRAHYVEQLEQQGFFS